MSSGKGWNRLRGKLAGLKDGSTRAGQSNQEDEDVADFLRPGSSTSSSNRPSLAPKLDIAAAQKSTNPHPTSNGQDGDSDAIALRNMNRNIEAPIPEDDGQKWRPSKNPRRAGLRVGFHNAAPQIIGEGGDESEETTSAISGRRARSSSSTSSPESHRFQPQPPPPPLPPHRTFEPPQSQVSGMPPPAPPKPSMTQENFDYLSTSPPVYSEPSSYADRPHTPQQRDPSFEQLLPSNSQLAGQPHPPELVLRKPTGSPNRFAPRKKPSLKDEASQQDLRKMRASEGQAFRQSIRASVSLPAASTNLSPTGLDPAQQQEMSSDRLSIDSTRTPSRLSQQSLSPEPSPRLERPSTSDSSHDIPKHLSPPGSSHSIQRKPLAPGSSGSDASREDHPARAPNDFKSARRKPSPGDATRRDNRLSLGVQDWNSLSQDFLDRLQAMDHIFQLELPRMSEDYSASDWLRSAIWWFSKGRTGFELYIRTNPDGALGKDDELDRKALSAVRQNHLDLAKAWWITQEILPSQMSRQVAVPESGEIQGQSTSIKEAIKRLASSLSKRNIIPSLSESGSGLDIRIWIDYPLVPKKTDTILSNGTFGLSDPQPNPSNSTLNLSFDDNSANFYYGSAFGNAIVAVENDQVHQKPFECAISLFRNKSSLELEATIATQNPLVQLAIRGSRSLGVKWEHVRWDAQECSLRVKLPLKHRIWLYMGRPAFEMIWTVYEQISRAFSSFQPRNDEQLLYQFEFQKFQFVDTAKPGFPQEELDFCRAAVIERSLPMNGSSSGQKIHGGYRLAITTDPYQSTLYYLSVDLGKRVPIEYTYDQSEPGSVPCMRLHIIEAGRRRSMSISFKDPGVRDMFRDFISGSMLKENEKIFVRLRLQSLEMSRVGDPSANRIVALKAALLQVINAVEPEQGEESDQLRIFAFNDSVSLVDRLHLSLGELQVRLALDNLTTIRFLRKPRRDLTIAVGPANAGPDTRLAMHNSHDLTATGLTVFNYTFHTLRELHDFETAVIRCDIVYDGKAKKIGIMRKPPGVFLHKSFETDGGRIQIIERGATVQMMAFFSNYEIADSLNFQLKTTDTYEKFDKAGEYSLRLVDAKFALPTVEYSDVHERHPKPRDVSASFVCPEYLDYPSEHDDITVSFDTEKGRDNFAEALPAEANTAKKFTLRKRT